MNHYLHVEAYENPIEKALEFKRIMEEENHIAERQLRESPKH